MAASFERVDRLLGRLKAMPEQKSGGVLSVYLDTSPERQLQRTYQTAFSNQVREQRESLGGEDLKAFNQLADRVEQFLVNEFVPGGQGVAIFVTLEPASLRWTTLPQPVPDQVRWGPRPDLFFLQQTVDDFEQVCLVQFDRERARLFLVRFGEIVVRRELTNPLPSAAGAGAPQERLGPERSRARFHRHREERALDHTQQVVSALQELLHETAFDHLILAGPPEAVSILQHRLTRPLRERFAGTVGLPMNASTGEILQVVAEAEQEIEREEELDLVDELIHSADPRVTAIGVEPTLAALSEGRVQTLLVSEGFADQGAQCPDCGYLVQSGGSCPRCGTTLGELEDLSSLAVRSALDQGARVNVVSSDAAELLDAYGGMGVWTYY